MCELCISNPFVDWHALEPSATGPLQAGTAAGGTSNGTSVSFNGGLVNQLDSGSVWFTSAYTVAQTISYGFTTSSAFASGISEATGWSAFTEAQKTATRQMMTLWDDLIAPSFVEATGSPNTADIKFSNTTTGPSYAWAYYPGQVNKETGSFDKIDGSVWLNPAYSSGNNNLVSPASGTFGFQAILHEIGHSLGLNHGGNYNGGGPQYGNTSTGWLYTEDSHQYTIMSYFNASATGANWGGKYAQTPMVYDILAIQQMYGADYTTRATDTTYGFNANAGNSLYDFTQNTSPILTIWDGNGVDTIDLSGWSSASTLNLTAGSYSSVNGMTMNLAIAYDVDIENATGGSGSDTITGNDLANTLFGNGGNDTINGAGGNDTIDGGSGIDILIGGAGDDTIYFDVLDNLTLLDGGAGFDTLIQLGVLITFDYAGHSFERLLNIITDLGAAAWSQQTDFYDLGGLYYECDITYDNGTRSVTEYDVYNTETWSEWTVTYDASGNFLSEVFVPDAGSGSGTAPTITSNGGADTAAVSVTENSTAVTTVTATDPDAGATQTYSIVGGADAAKFTINASTGLLSFVSAPNFEAPTDAGGNNVYDVQVRASDGTLTDTQSIAVTVTNQNEAPTITSNGAGVTATVNVTENTTAVTTVTSTDPDAGAAKTYAITGGADASKFAINAATGVLTFVAAPNLEAPTDAGLNNVYDVVVQVSDGTLTDTQSIAVTVTNQNEAPAITSNGGGDTATVSVVENSTAVTTVTAADPDAGATQTYAIVGGADAAKFTINTATGLLSFVTTPNFDTPGDVGANNVYDVQVRVTDGSLTDTQTIAVTVTNQNEAPTITSNGGGLTAATNVAENSTAVTTVTATDPDAGATQSYAIVGGADAAKFTINAATGVLAFVSTPNFEAATDVGANNVYDVQVQVSDGTQTDTQTIAVTVTNQNEAPAITSNGGGATAAISVVENTAAVTTVTSTDPDAGATRAYAIVGGADASKFTINAATGLLAFVAAPSFEAPTDVGADNVYDVQVQVTDGTLTDTQSIAVTVTDQNEAPAITSNGAGVSAAINVVENGTAVSTLTATDADAGAQLTYSIIGGADAANFTIDASTGALRFVSAPDFEAPADAGANNVYDVVVQVSDGTLTDTQSVAVTVTNQNEAPTIIAIDSGASTLAAQGIATPVALNVAEGTTAVAVVEASDPDTGAILTYAISGGADASKFTINAATGALSFTAAPDFEAPADVGADNVYDVDVRVSDGVLSDTKAIAVTVTDVDDALIVTPITGTTANNVLTGTAGLDLIDGLAGNDTLAGLSGADALIGGAGADTATYAASAAGVVVSLTTGLGSSGDAEGDTLSGIENLTGSALNDTLEGNAGTNTLIGGAGTDTLSYAHATATVTVSLASTKAQNTGGAGRDTVSGFENITGSNFNDRLTGNSASNIIRGGAGNDILAGGSGSDTFDFSSLANGSDVVTDFASGSDKIDLTEVLAAIGLADLDYAALTGGGYLIVESGKFSTGQRSNSSKILDTRISIDADGAAGLGGAVVIATLEDTKTSSANFKLVSTIAPLADVSEPTVTDVSAPTSLNEITGSHSNNTLNGSASADLMRGLGGSDTLKGNNGDDILVGGAGRDTLNGGSGSDWAAYAGSAAVAVDLGRGTASGGDAAGDRFSSIENLRGSDFNDTLTGSSAANTIDGGLGNDTLTGGGGGDTFHFNDLTFGRDRITDYQDGVDKLAFTSAVAASLADLIITDNGTTSVTVSHSADSVTVVSSVAFTLEADDFIFA